MKPHGAALVLLAACVGARFEERGRLDGTGGGGSAEADANGAGSDAASIADGGELEAGAPDAQSRDCAACVSYLSFCVELGCDGIDCTDSGSCPCRGCPP